MTNQMTLLGRSNILLSRSSRNFFDATIRLSYAPSTVAVLAECEKTRTIASKSGADFGSGCVLNMSRESVGVSAAPHAPAIRHRRRLRPATRNGHGGVAVETGVHYLKPGPRQVALVPVVGTPPKAKRALDVLIATVMLFVLSPVMLVIATIVAVTSSGGPIFMHERIGRDGRSFTLYKFRSMRAGTCERVMNDPDLLAHYRANNFKLDGSHDAITQVGRWLRKSSLDELPQLWNVLIGDMSLVGVRPLVADEFASRPVYDQRLYVSLPPGLTGLWQVEGRSAIGGAERTELDRRYVERWSFWGDVRILARTPRAVLSPANTH